MSVTTPFKLLYVCNGNNSRSPLAAAFTYDRVSRRSGTVQWQITSAGTDVRGSGVRPEGQRAAMAMKLDLSEHRTRPPHPGACLQNERVLAVAVEPLSPIWSPVP